jgi:hypothetical protein
MFRRSVFVPSSRADYCRFSPSSVILAIGGVFTPVLAKHSKSFSLIDCISVGVDRMRRNFEITRDQAEAWQRSELTDVTAKVVIYAAFVESKLEAPKQQAPTAARPLLRAKTRGIPSSCHLEPLERVDISFEGTGSSAAIQGDSQTR